jgi:hypothetical protein
MHVFLLEQLCRLHAFAHPYLAGKSGTFTKTAGLRQ